jgi:hypothetical protein
MPPITADTIAAKLGVHKHTVHRARARLKLTGWTRAVEKAIAANVTAGRGKSPLGRWPKGKRRNDLPGWETTRKQLARIVAERISIAESSRRIGVDSRSVRRWLSGQLVPSPAHASQVRALVRRLS